VVEAAPDDLTAIRGIGPGIKERLNQAGIYTFAQIAHSTPDALRELLGDVSRIAKVEMWIEQAGDMAGIT
jgi:predicted flap endonuclease-1-like 5' DNA nuclease